MISAWDRAARLLGENEGEYWNNTSANTYQTEDNTEVAHGFSMPAIGCN
jgi:hypothetical protein